MKSNGEEELVADAESKEKNKLSLRLADSEDSVVCEFNSENVNKNYYFKAGECKSLVSIMSK